MDSLGAISTRFGFDLFKELKKTNDGNIFFSPVGLLTAIGMLLLGTRGATASQLEEVGRSRGASVFSMHKFILGVVQPSCIILKIYSWWTRKQRLSRREAISGLSGKPSPLSKYPLPTCSQKLEIVLSRDWLSDLV